MKRGPGRMQVGGGGARRQWLPAAEAAWVLDLSSDNLTLGLSPPWECKEGDRRKRNCDIQESSPPLHHVPGLGDTGHLTLLPLALWSHNRHSASRAQPLV